MKTLSVYSVCWLLCSTVWADPTRPAADWQAADIEGVAATQLTQPRLQLIKQTASGPVALLDGVLVRKGERYKQYRILDIQATQLVMDLNGEQLVLPLLNTAIKQYEE
ncbi:MAG TPA: hypothetical protein VFY01_06250 [Rheinheimera sp.]|nr:hypothetical protein [Rheinheimera sp.]